MDYYTRRTIKDPELIHAAYEPCCAAKDTGEAVDWAVAVPSPIDPSEDKIFEIYEHGRRNGLKEEVWQLTNRVFAHAKFGDHRINLQPTEMTHACWILSC
jgi:hypothetical protein